MKSQLAIVVPMAVGLFLPLQAEGHDQSNANWRVEGDDGKKEAIALFVPATTTYRICFLGGDVKKVSITNNAGGGSSAELLPGTCADTNGYEDSNTSISVTISGKGFAFGTYRILSSE
ncbi:MAG: hypothetical protein AAGF53_03610 [Pseudomonadota bacterium]